VAPSFLVTAVLAFFNVAVKSVQENQKIEEQEHPIEQKTVPLLSEPPPSKTVVRQAMPPEIVEKIRPRDQPLDRDIGMN
jgi:hypothetical protein